MQKMIKMGISERDQDLLKAYRNALDKASYPFSLFDVLSITVKSPAKRYYVGVRGVCEAISKLKSNKAPNICEERKRLVYDILPLVEEMERKHPDRLLRDIVEEILDSPAPEFYIKTSSAKIIIHHILKQLKMNKNEKKKICG